jgi:hypothetical protein
MQAEVAALFEKEQEKVTKKILNHK